MSQMVRKAVDTAVRTEWHGSVLLALMDSPPVNSISRAVRVGLLDALERARRGGAHALVLAGAGNGFSAGADITEFGEGGFAEPRLTDILDEISDSQFHTIAALHGSVLGGGLELALSCHWRVAAASTRLGLPEVHIGLIPGGGGTQRLPRLVGCEAAISFIAGGAPSSARRALKDGLIDKIGDEGAKSAPIKAALEMARSLGSRPLDPARVLASRPLPPPDGGAAFFEAARQAVRAKARGEIAPVAAVDAVEAAVGAPSFAAGMERESAIFTELVVGKQAAALRHVFFSERQMSRLLGPAARAKPRPVASAAVVGAGTMGQGIAMCFANAGIPVTLVDASADALRRAKAAMAKTWGKAAERGQMSADEAKRRGALVTPAERVETAGVAGADVVVEAVFEKLQVKQSIFRALDAVCKKECVLATNTSTLDVDAIGAATSRPASVCGMHFFSPAHVMPLLENVRGARTSDEVVATAMALGRRLGKKAVLANNCFGFIGNRMLEGTSREALALLADGASVAQIDGAMREFGYAMGPMQVADVAGNDIPHAIRNDPSSAERIAKYKVAGARDDTGINDALVAQGRLGQKSKKGWYDYSAGRDGVADRAIDEMINAYRASRGITPRHVSDDEVLDRCLIPLVNEGFKARDASRASLASSRIAHARPQT